ncbi:MAG: STN and carboxypeptidase regulatory-like domain-containing protein, partial [Chitinophaga rupis]
MKKSTTCQHNRFARATMRLLLISLVIGCLPSLQAQQKKEDKEWLVSLRAKHLTLEKVFGLIEQQTGLSFVYDSREIKEKLALPCDLPEKATPVARLLEMLTRQSGLRFSRVGKTIAVQSAADKPAGPAALPEMIAGHITDESSQAPLAGASVLLEETRQST